MLGKSIVIGRLAPIPVITSNPVRNRGCSRRPWAWILPLFVGRQHRSLFTLYCDEIQNLVAIDSGLDTLISEARKFAVGICSANQFLDQYPAHMRAAILAVGTHIFFQLSSHDAEQIASALGGGRTLGDLLKNLPARQMVVKSGHHRWQQVQVPPIPEPRTDWRQEMPYYTRTRVVFQSRTRFWKKDGVSPNWEPPHATLRELWHMADEVSTPRGILIGGAEPGVTAKEAEATFHKLYPGKSADIEQVFVHDWSKDPGPRPASASRSSPDNWPDFGRR